MPASEGTLCLTYSALRGYGRGAKTVVGWSGSSRRRLSPRPPSCHTINPVPMKPSQGSNSSTRAAASDYVSSDQAAPVSQSLAADSGVPNLVASPQSRTERIVRAPGRLAMEQLPPLCRRGIRDRRDRVGMDGAAAQRSRPTSAKTGQLWGTLMGRMEK